ncbi:MAG: hypothetical protein D8M58_21810 [Calditrichaeota bacterium]|nr:MAG: hypothetical protein DWQ03_00665 [Calditrichota bacterium]MBL1208052.1 hypothetical protein [Calditrichota bacterium]NOG47887.1 hypothetical protein [Calditrichota bacterium]
MPLTPESEIREVYGLNDNERELIEVFMQGAIYCWIKNKTEIPFAVRDLVGGVNSDWNGTPLQVLYDKHIKAGKDEDASFESAAIDLGWIVKKLLSNDNRLFKKGTNGLVNTYLWIPN